MYMYMYMYMYCVCPFFDLQYDGGRTTADFVKFLNEKAGTQRLPGGKLSDQVSYMYMYEYKHRL